MPEVIALLSSSADESESEEAGAGNKVTLVVEVDDDDSARSDDDALLAFDWRASQSTQASQTVASSTSPLSAASPLRAAASAASSDSDLDYVAAPTAAAAAPKAKQRPPAAKARKQAELAARKQLRTELKENKRSAAAQAKRTKKILKLEEQIASGKHCTREITVMAYPTVQRTVARLEFTLLAERRNAIEFCDNAPLDLVYFARRQTRLNEADLSLGFFEPEIDSAAALVLSGEALVDLLAQRDGRIDGVVERVDSVKGFLAKQGALPPFRIFVLVFALDKAGAAPSQVDQSVTQLYMQHGIEAIKYQSADELSDGLWNMVLGLEAAPYRKDPTVLDMKRKHKRESTKVDDGIALTDVWLNMLRCVRGLASDKDKPETVVSQGGFATFRSMFDEFNDPAEDQVALRTKVATLAGNGKRLAHKVASDLAVVMTSRNPDAPL